MIEQKQQDLIKIKEKVNDMKKVYDIKEKNPVVMGVGRQAFYKLVKEMKPTKKLEYTIKWTAEYIEDWARDNLNANKKGIEVKTLARCDDETKRNLGKWLKVDKEIRKFDNDGVAVDIRDEEVLIRVQKLLNNFINSLSYLE